jgi:hypothetical protein
MCTHHVQMCYMTADVDIPEETYGERETVVFMAGDAGDGGQRAGGGETLRAGHCRHSLHEDCGWASMV